MNWNNWYRSGDQGQQSTNNDYMYDKCRKDYNKSFPNPPDNSPLAPSTHARTSPRSPQDSSPTADSSLP